MDYHKYMKQGDHKTESTDHVDEPITANNDKQQVDDYKQYRDNQKYMDKSAGDYLKQDGHTTESIELPAAPDTEHYAKQQGDAYKQYTDFQ